MTTTKTFSPWREGQLFLTDGGIETEIMYKWGFELPHFAMYPLLDEADAMAAVRGMYRRHLDVIARHRLSALMGALARRYPRMDVWGGRLLRDRERPPRRDRPQPGRRPAGEVPYEWWRDYDPEDALRFYALRLHDVGMIKSSPKKIIADGTDWRFLNELKRELKA